MRRLGFMSENEQGNFNPQFNLTRAEAANVFMKFPQILPHPHIYIWVKLSQGKTADWIGGTGPDENEYTTN